MTFATIMSKLSAYNKAYKTDFYFAVKPSDKDSGLGFYRILSPISGESQQLNGVFWYDRMAVNCKIMEDELEAFFSTPFTPCYK